MTSPDWLPYVLLWGIFLAEVPTFGRRREEAQNRDRGSYFLFYLLAGGGFWLAFCIRSHLRAGSSLQALRNSLRLSSWALPVSILLTVAGTAYRMWAIKTLGRYFTRVVQVSSEQPVIADGPYRYLRHPSYAGGLVALFGASLSLGNWLSVLCGTLPLAVCYFYRMHIEEKALVAAIGEPYRRYMAKTKRLVPFVY